MKRSLLAFEILVLFVIPPLLIFYEIIPRKPFPYIIIATLYALAILNRQAKLTSTMFWGQNYSRQSLFKSLRQCLVATLFIAGFVLIFYPEMFLSFPLERPKIWLLVTLLYPLLSALPQELIYRTFFFSRYQDFFGSEKVTIIASTLLFAYAHMIYLHPVSILFCLVGGFIFSLSYVRTRALLFPALEHALLGLAVFTLGIGKFFYHGAVK
ncbi:CPBP family intramembrane metalloprotease [bacterium]|nr:CPBP family intramembrane metalloprotease [bacterium]